MGSWVVIPDTTLELLEAVRRMKNVMRITGGGAATGKGTRGRGNRRPGIRDYPAQVKRCRRVAIPIVLSLGNLGGFGDLSEREPHFEGAAFAGFAGDGDLSVVFVDDAADE
jgi:hypothetical protein